MPELPEVEITRLGFADRIAGALIEQVFIGKSLRWPLGVDPCVLEGQRVCAVGRRGKYLLIHLERGLLLVHLGMSGHVQFAERLPERGVHDHVELYTSQGIFRLHDPRRFGAVVYAPQGLDDPVAHKLLGGLGWEPLEPAFESLAFYQALRQRRGAIKTVLLGGDVVVGVGNIYASESLFMAGIRPTTVAHRLSKLRVARLHAAVVTVLRQALAAGGSSLRDFKHTDGQNGYFQLDAAVYGRAGEPCRVCTTPIKTLRQGQRSTFFCIQCQKP